MRAQNSTWCLFLMLYLNQLNVFELTESSYRVWSCPSRDLFHSRCNQHGRICPEEQRSCSCPSRQRLMSPTELRNEYGWEVRDELNVAENEIKRWPSTYDFKEKGTNLFGSLRIGKLSGIEFDRFAGHTEELQSLLFFHRPGLSSRWD